MIQAVSILSKPGFIAMKDYAGPVHVDVGMLKILTSKKYILDVRNNFIPISTKYFKQTLKSSFTERKEGKFGKHFRSVDTLVRSFYDETGIFLTGT